MCKSARAQARSFVAASSVADRDLRAAAAPLLFTSALIGGRWRGESAFGGFEVTDPGTGRLLATVVEGLPLAAEAVDTAVEAFPAWSAQTAAARSLLLWDWARLIRENEDGLAALISLEQGKPLAESRAEVAYGAGYVEWYAEEARRAYGDVIPSPHAGQELLVLKEPVGVAAVITPWNFPLAMLARKLAPAVAAGCTAVAKPAAETPLSALALAGLAEKAGFPAGVMNVVPSNHASEVADVWMNDERVRKISFTGSTRVGSILAGQGAHTIKRLSLELGGDAPFIVFDDADLDAAVEALMKAKFRNAGQACVAANRVYVQAEAYDDFIARLTARVKLLTVGAASEGAYDVGPLIHQRASESLDQVVRLMGSQGARLISGGRPHPLGGSFYEPTLLIDVPSEAAADCGELFGPVIIVSKFHTEPEVIRLANASQYGLAAYVCSNDLPRIWRLSRRLEAGMIGVNGGTISTEVAPFGGVKGSGYGREGSRYGLADYQSIKLVALGGLV